MQLTSSLQMTAAYWANLTVNTRIYEMELDIWVYWYPQLAVTLKFISRNKVYVLLKKNVVMKEKLHEDSTNAAKTPLLIYNAKIDDYT